MTRQGLSPHHVAQLQASAIAPDVIAARGYFTATTKSTLEALGFPRAQQQAPALAIPIYTVAGTLAFHMIRPDTPRWKDGKPLKYELPARSTMALDAPHVPWMRAAYADPARPLFVTEGAKKVDALVSLGCPTVGVIGTWAFLGTNTQQAKMLLSDWYEIGLTHRLVYLVYDSDIMTKPSVHQALRVLSERLKAREAQVRYIYLPSSGGQKIGVDDYLAAGHTLDDLLGLSSPVLKAPSRAASTGDQPVGLPLSDHFNTLDFVREHGANVHYCYPWKSWVVWTGTHWRRDEIGTVMQWAKATIRGMLDTLKDIADTKARDALYSHIKSSLSASRLEGMVTLARDEPDIPMLPDAIDQHHWLLNCANGTLDLRTGALRPHTRDDLLTKCLALAYDPEAPCPTWERFLWRIMGGSMGHDTPDDSAAVHHARSEADARARRLISFLQRAVGYSLTGDTSEHCFFLLYGTGRNGKSTFIETIQALLGPYGKTAEMSTFLARQTEGVRDDLADLHGARFVSASEADKGKRLAESLVKRITGGETIKARFLFEKHFEFQPQMHVWLAVNDKPVIRGTDLAMWERIRLIPFEVFLTPEERDKHLGEKLRAELPGILTWAVKGCLEWQRYDGLKEPEEVIQATEAYRKDMDVLGQFLDECCTLAPGLQVKAGTMYKAYQTWCEEHGRHPESMTEMGYRLDAMAFQKKKSNGWWYLGLGLNATINQ